MQRLKVNHRLYVFVYIILPKYLSRLLQVCILLHKVLTLKTGCLGVPLT